MLWLSAVLVVPFYPPLRLLFLLLIIPSFHLGHSQPHADQHSRLLTTATPHTPQPARLLLLLLVGVSFPFSFQFFTRLDAVFAKEVGGFFVFLLNS